MPPTTTQISATLNTAKSMKVVSNMSVTKPKAARSMRLPTAPASTRARGSRPQGWRNTFTISTATAADAASDTSVKSQVCRLSMEKAAPVFWI